MTEQEYIELVAACDRLLRAPGTRLARVAIPVLHVINEHPGNLGPFRRLVRPDDAHTEADPGREPEVPSGLAEPVRAVARAGRALWRSSRRHHRDGATWSADMSGTDVLIVSRLLTSKQLESTDDFYFGALQRQLADRGASSVILYMDHRPEGDLDPAGRIEASRGVLPRTIAPATEALIWAECARVRSDLRASAARSSVDSIDSHVALLASRHATLETTVSNLRLHASVAAACRALRPRIVITLHEGDASERVIWSAARSNGSRPLCVGYQHTRLLRRAHAIRRSLNVAGIDCDPDVILTLGEIPHATLAASPELESVRLITYGSHRRSAPDEPPPQRERRQHCLVLPDADEGECGILFDFAAACARSKPEMTFSLRPHPIMNVAALKSRHPALAVLPPNVSFSSGRSLEADCSGAGYCLYRGSSAVIHAVLAGVRPFYVSRPRELTFDTLHELQEWRETVTSPREFVAGTCAVEPPPEAALRAWSYCDRYVSAVRPEAIDALLEAA